MTPNWQCLLPGFPYDGDDPHGFMEREQIAAYVEAYAASFELPRLEGVTVTMLRQTRGGFALTTTAGDFGAERVVIATGGHHVPRIPRFAERLPDEILQASSSQYRNPDALPEGDVLVVGTGQSGCQIAEDLHLAGRTVHSASAARRGRRAATADATSSTGCTTSATTTFPCTSTSSARTCGRRPTSRSPGATVAATSTCASSRARACACTGAAGSARRRALVRARPHAQPRRRRRRVGGDQGQNRRAHRGKRIQAPSEPRYEPVWQPGVQPRELDVAAAGLRSVVWCIGFEEDYRRVRAPVFDGRGSLCHERGETCVPGLYVVGLPWLYTWGSGRFCGVARDTEYLADLIELDRRTPAHGPPGSRATVRVVAGPA